MVAPRFPARFDVYLVALDPTVGSEIKKTRPCVVVSPNEQNRTIAAIIVAPMTKGEQEYFTRIPTSFQGKEGYIAVDQLRVVDKMHLIKRLGRITPDEANQVIDRLVRLFQRGKSDTYP